MIRCCGTGEVVSEVRVNEVGEKKVKVANFRIKSIEKLAPREGSEEKSIHTYSDVEVWDSAAENVIKNLKEGDEFIIIQGKKRTNSWTSKDKVTGEEKKNFKDVIRVEEFRIVKSSK